MSNVQSPSINPPDLGDLLDELKNEIFANLNCMQIGRIESVNLDEQTVEAAIQVKRRINKDETKKYPLLVDVPFIVVQGGGAFLELPIKKDDYCLIFFNDRCIDNWWKSGNVTEPLTTRKHDLSDGIALVGLNPKSSVLDLTGDIVKLNATGFDLILETDKNINIKGTGDNKTCTIETKGDIIIKNTTTGKKVNIETSNGTCNIKCMNVNIGGDETLTEELIKATSFLNDLIIAFNAHTHQFVGTGSVGTPNNPWVASTTFVNSKSQYNKTS